MKYSFNYKKRGRPVKAKYWKSVWFLLFVIVMTSIAGHNAVVAGDKEIEAKTLKEVTSQLIDKTLQTSEENKSLKDKLEDTLHQVFSFNKQSDWDTFVEQVKALAPVYDYPVNVVLAQAALESGHGSSGFAKERHNYFGFKCYDGREQEMCAYFSTPAESAIEYMRLIKYSPRYAKAYAVRNNPDQMIEEISKAGYATDPNYAAKVKSMKEWNQK